MKALITGVSGFVGSYLASHLASSGFEVFGFDRSGKRVDGCVVELCDINDAAAVAKLVKKISPSLVFHLAGQSSVAKSWDEPELTRRINADGTRNLFDAVAAAGIKPRVLLVSSAEVYGIPGKFPTPETHEISPVSPYGESKVEQEKIALENVARGLRVVISRSFNHTGPGQSSEFVCSNFARQVADIEAKRQQPVIKVGDLSIRRDFSDVRDVVRAYLLLLEKGVSGEAYNVCSGNSVAIGDVIGKLASLSSVKFKVERDPARVSDRVVIPRLQGDHSKLTAATGWRPALSFEQTLSDLLAYWRNRT